MRRVAAACLIAGTALAGCAAPRQTLGTSASACFRSLPTARAAVRQQGRLVGVRRISRVHLSRDFPQAALPNDKDFCVVAFSDSFRSDQVDKASGASTGKNAVVIVNMRGNSLIQTWLTDRVPFRITHR